MKEINFTLVSCLVYSSALKTEAICSSEIKAEFQRITRCYIPEERSLHINYVVHNLTHNFVYKSLSSITLPSTSRSPQLSFPFKSVKLHEIQESGKHSRYNDWLRTGRPSDRRSSPSRVKNFLFSKSARPALTFIQPRIQ
jgi:hypothetical protein